MRRDSNAIPPVPAKKCVGVPNYVISRAFEWIDKSMGRPKAM